MTKNEFNNKDKGINNDLYYSKLFSDDTNKNTNQSLNNNKKNIRKDGKGIPIIKKKLLFKKTKHHAYLKDDLFSGESIVHVIDVPSYKKYNMDSDIIEEEDENEDINNKLNINVNNEIHHCQCCIIV